MAKRKAYISTMYNSVYQFPHLIIMNRFNEDNSLPLTGSNPTYGKSTRLPKLKNGLTAYKWVFDICLLPRPYNPINWHNLFSPRFKNRVCGTHMSFWCSLITKTGQPELIFLTRFLNRIDDNAMVWHCSFCTQAQKPEVIFQPSWQTDFPTR